MPQRYLNCLETAEALSDEDKNNRRSGNLFSGLALRALISSRLVYYVS